MKPMISSLCVTATIFLMGAPVASALSCAEQAASLQERQVKAQEIAESRAVLVEQVEDAGDAWENAETMRNFGDAEAAEADATKTKYETLKADLLEQETTLQSLVIALNSDIEAYNAACVKEQGR